MTPSMSTTLFRRLYCAAVILITTFRATLVCAQSDAELVNAQLNLFEKHIRPALVEYCLECHAADTEASGGLLLTQPRLASDMARAALADATRGGARTVVTEAPGCLAHLRAHAGDDVEVKGLYELLAQHVLSAEG